MKLFIVFLIFVGSSSTSTQISDANAIINSSRFRRALFGLGSCKSVVSGDCLNSNVSFTLFTNPYPKTDVPIKLERNSKNFNLLKSCFDPTLPTKFIIHGYNSNRFLKDLVHIKDEYLNTTDLNVIFVDWSGLGKGPCYPAAVWNAKFVGACTALLIDKIAEAGGRDIHLIGFSLGAHIAGFAADHIKSYRIPRITGLDPAMPGFMFVGNNKLDKSDAIFVDVIHTNGLMQGKIERSGNVDFYVNGGSVQPGCGLDIFACNHHRAIRYFAESINSRVGFWAWPCTSYFYYTIGLCSKNKTKILMGEHVERSSDGVFFLQTNDHYPFALGIY